MVAHPKSGRLSKEYLFYCLKFSDLSSTISGSAQPQITRASLSPFKIPLPPLTVQKEIVAELDSYQKIIDGAKQVVDNWKPHIDIDPEWDSYPYKEIFTTLTAPMKIQTSEYSSSGAYPIIDQSMHEIAGWTDDERALVRIEKPVVIFGDHTCRIKYISKNFCQGADGIKILSTTENVIPKYLYYYLLAFPITPQGYNRHFSKLVEKEISIPELDVQQIIVSRIESEQKLVEANRKLIALFEQKIKERINRLWETNQKRPL